MSTPSVTSSHDPRDRLVREKYFSLRPKPLERYLWQQGLPQAAERVFWLHWEEGMRAGDWCSQVPIKRVASLCCVDSSTVTRAYQLLKNLGLLRRADPGRDPDNPFQQATAVTEVRVPRELLTELARFPNRPAPKALRDAQTPVFQPPQPTAPPTVTASAPECAPSSVSPTRALPPPTRQAVQATWDRASATERTRYFEASRSGHCHIDFDNPTRLSAPDRALILAQLEQLSRARTEKPKAPAPMPAPATVSRSGSGASSGSSGSSTYAQRRRLSALELARTRRKLIEVVPTRDAAETLRQVTWAVEEGALRRFDLPLAINIALKKIREGAWTRPNRMPPNWMRAQPETCSAA